MLERVTNENEGKVDFDMLGACQAASEAKRGPFKLKFELLTSSEHVSDANPKIVQVYWNLSI